MSWEPTWVPDGRGGFNRQRPEDESEEPTDEEEGEISGRNEFRPRFGPRGRGFVGHHRGGGRGGGGRGEFFFREPAVQGNFPPRQPFREGPFRAERGRATSVGGFHRPPELHREGSFGVTTRTDHHRDGSFARDVPPFRDMAAPVRDPMFGARNDGPPRELTREGPFGPRGGDLPLREPMREPSFGPRVDMGGLPPREIGREGSFGLRGADIGGPPRDTLREPPFGPRGDSGGPARDSGRDGAFGPRGTDIGGQMRDHVRETSFGPRGLDQGGPAREIGPRGPGAPFTRGGTPLARDGGPPPPIPFHRNDTPRETSFSDLAGPLPPRDRPFRDESTPRGRVVSQGPGYPTTIPLTAPADPRRPTDPRRRSSHDLGGLNSAGPPHISGDGPNDGPPLTNPQPGRRLGSYSSLADNSTIPTNPMPAPAPLHSTGEAFRSPVGRRIQQDQAPRNTDPFNGPPLTQTRQPSWSPAIERRTLSGSPRNVPSIKVPGFNSEHPPSAPPLSRGGSFRDPRFKSNDNPDSRPDLNSTPAVFPSRNKSLSVSEDLGTGRTRQPLPKSSPKSSPTKPVVQSSPSKEDPKISELLPAAPELSASKLNTPLLTSALGHGDIVQRAETAVLHLSEVVDSKDIKAADGLSKLPAKQMIMTAVTEIEKLIKETQQELERLHDEHKDAVKEQVKDDELEQKRLEAKEDMRITEVEQRQKQEAKLQEHLKVKGLQRAIEERQEDFDNARKKLEEEFEQRIEQAKMDQQSQFEQKLEAHVNNVQQGWNKDIVKARNFVEKAKSSTVRLEAKVAAAESEYQSFLESAQNETDQPKSRPTSSQGGSMPSLVEQIIADNHRKAKEAQMMTFSIVSENDPPFIESDPGSGGPKDPALGETCEEWSVLAKQVTGFADALYTEPSEAPYYQKNERSHALLGPTIKECIRDQKRQLVENWTVLAEEYEVRKRLYDKQQRKLAKKAQRGSVSVVRKSIFAGDKESSTHGQSGDKGNILESGRSSNNPYRRARRGNEVRSEYEQEQIIAEIAAKEAMEKRITFGSCKLPRQIVRLERGLIATYINTFNSYKVDDPLKEDQESRMNNVWTDMEKCIFLDRFLQFPKDFRRIASFLRNKTTKDCVAFYYDSKQTVAYKGALKEHVMRRKRKGDYAIWDASIQAALSVGAIVTAGLNEEKPLEFSLPPSDRSYRTYMLHPLQQPVLESMPIDEEAARQHEAEARPEEAKVKSKKRFRDPLFSLDKEHTKFLRLASQESMSGVIRVKSAPVEEEEEEKEKAITEPEPEELHELNSPPTPVRKAPQKWTTAEKRIFAETLEQYGRDWAKLASAVGTKNEKQIKNFYYDWKKGKSRPPSEKKVTKKERAAKAQEELRDEGIIELQEDVVDDRSEEGIELHKKVENPSSQEDFVHQAAALADLRAQAEALAKVQDARQRHGIVELADVSDYPGANHDLIQQFLNQQYQQQGQQQPQSALQQLLGQQQLHREQQHRNQLSLEDARRLLEHHQAQRGPLLSNLLSSQWLGAPQMLPGQPGLSSHSITSALRADGSAIGSGISEMGGEFQRLLHLHRASQGIGMQNRSSNLASLLLGAGGGELSGSNSNNLSANILHQLASVGTGSDASDHLSSLVNAQSLLGFGGGANVGASSIASSLYRQTGTGGMDSAGVSDALSLLARSMQRSEGNSHGLGRMHDSSDGSTRYN